MNEETNHEYDNGRRPTRLERFTAGFLSINRGDAAARLRREVEGVIRTKISMLSSGYENESVDMAIDSDFQDGYDTNKKLLVRALEHALSVLKCNEENIEHIFNAKERGDNQ